MAKIKLNQQLRRVEIENFEISNEIVFNYFNNLPTAEREKKLFKALYIGVLASMEDRLSAFLAKTSNELGTELESLKMIFEMKKELFYKTTVKGLMAEDDVADFLNNYFEAKGLKDAAVLTGNVSGKLHKNKTGDIVCTVEGAHDLKIVIECKFDKSVKLGDIESKDVFTKKMDTAWSQLIEAAVNRDAKVSIIIFDKSLVDNSILKKCDNVGFFPAIGFVAIIDSQKGDYSNLAISYMLARDIALNARKPDLDLDLLVLIVGRIVKDINEIKVIKELVESNIQNNKQILKQLEKSMLLMSFNQEYLKRFIQEGTLTQKDLLAFYMTDEVKEKYKLIEKNIEKGY